MALTADLARRYAQLGTEVAFAGGVFESAALVAALAAADGIKRERFRIDLDEDEEPQLTFPDGRVLAFPDHSGTLATLDDIVAGTGDVTGPASSTDNALARYDLATGKLLQDSVAILSDAGALSGLLSVAGQGSGTAGFKLAEQPSNSGYFDLWLGAPGSFTADNYVLDKGTSGDLTVNTDAGKAIYFTADNQYSPWLARLDANGFQIGGDGATATAITLKPAVGGSARTATFQDASGTVAYLSDIPTVDKAYIDALGVNAATVTTNANLTGPITSVGNATSIASQTGTGTKFVVDTSPVLVTPNIGVATGTSLALTGTASKTLNVVYTSSGTGTPQSQYGSWLEAVATPASTSSANYFALATRAGHGTANNLTGALIGVESTALHTGASNVARVLGIDIKAFNGNALGTATGSSCTFTRMQAGLFQSTRTDASSSTTARLDGIALQANSRSPGTITELNGLAVALGQADGGAGAGTVTAMTGVKVTCIDPTVGLDIMTGGTVTNWYGVKIEDPTSGPTYTNAPEAIHIDSFTPTSIGIRQVSTSMTNRFAGNTKIGADSAPAAALDVTGSALVSGSIGAASLDLATIGTGNISLAQGFSVWLGGVGTGSRVRQNASANMVFSQGGTDRMTLSGNALAIGTTAAPTANTVLDLVSTTGALLLPRMTSTQRDAMTAVNGMVIYNTTVPAIQGYQGGAWTNL